MGASIGTAVGMTKVVSEEEKKKVVAVIGDSTFLHTGINGLLDMVYNKSTTTLIILDNRITAMTGRQENPASGYTLMNNESHEVDLAEICRAIGVKHVTVIDPYEMDNTRELIRREMARPEPSVIITRRHCMLMKRDVVEKKPPLFVEVDKCTGCKVCLQIGCPAIEWDATAGERGQAKVNRILCVGCGQCCQVCKFDAFGVCND
jgi:indolepyruvate ferredoxin oxidoreductase alpha subunit